MVSRTERTPFAHWWWTVDRLLLAAIGILMLAGIILLLAASGFVLVSGVGFAVALLPLLAVVFMRPAMLKRAEATS